MLNSFCRPKASCSLLRVMRFVALLPGIYPLAVPIAHAAETITTPQSAPSADRASIPSPALLSQYRKWQDAPVQDWTASNDRVGEIGGWQTYLRDAQAPAGAPAAGGHGRHGQ